MEQSVKVRIDSSDLDVLYNELTKCTQAAKELEQILENMNKKD
ncbi:hypothetical protein [uncultured Lactobacillus sp.]|nr:hypothetical protein [uncultured Lactobacillus sp.]